MNAPSAKLDSRRLPSDCPLQARGLLAISFGLCAGYLDLFLMLFKKYYWKDEWILRFGRDYPWTVPVAHAVLLLIPAIVIAALGPMRRRFVSMRGFVAVCDTRDLGGPLAAAAVWRLQPHPGRWPGPADR